MKRMLIVLGSVVAIVILILTSFTSIVSAQATESNISKTIILRKIKDKKTANNDWDSGQFTELYKLLFYVLLSILLYLRWLFFGIDPDTGFRII